RLRRAQATGEAHFCDEARQALAGSPSTEPSAAELLTGLGSTTIIREPQDATVAEDVSDDTSLSLSNYALGYVDALQAPTPLPQYLAAVYGGVVVGADARPALDGQTPVEELVDRAAPAYPLWKPDAIYAALGSA